MLAPGVQSAVRGRWGRDLALDGLRCKAQAPQMDVSSLLLRQAGGRQEGAGAG